MRQKIYIYIYKNSARCTTIYIGGHTPARPIRTNQRSNNIIVHKLFKIHIYYTYCTQHNICHAQDLQATSLHSLQEEHDSALQHNPLNSTGGKTGDKYTVAIEIPYSSLSIIGYHKTNPKVTGYCCCAYAELRNPSYFSLL